VPWRQLRRLVSRFSRDMGIDLGTCNTLVHVRGRGIVVREPSVVAIDQDTGRVLAVGSDAKRMVGRTPGRITAVRPLKAGVIADFDVTEIMLRHFIRRVHRGRTWLGPRVVIGLPSDVTEVERRAVEDAARSAGAWFPEIIDEPMAAAIGAGLPVAEPGGNMIVDMGGGTTEVAVISLGGICTRESTRVAGDDVDVAISNYVRQQHSLFIGETTAEQIKIEIGAAFPRDDETEMQVRGRDIASGLPRSITLSTGEIREACEEPLSQVVEAVKTCLERTAPELSADIMTRGIVLAGGGALLRGIDQLISAETGVPVYVAEDPLTCVALGTAKYLEELDGAQHDEGL